MIKKWVVTITEMVPTERSNSDIVTHVGLFTDFGEVLELLEEAFINFTVFVSVAIAQVEVDD